VLNIVIAQDKKAVLLYRRAHLPHSDNHVEITWPT